MNYYIGIVDRGGEGFGIWFPDLPGCTSGGRTMNDLFDMGAEAMTLWAEARIARNMAVPAPRDLDGLRADPDVEEALSEDANATFLRIPLLLDKGRARSANLSIDAGLLEAIDAAAKESGVTRSAFLASTARDKILRRQAGPKS